MEKSKTNKHLNMGSIRNYSLDEKARLIDESIWGNNLSWSDIEHMAQYFDVYSLQPNLKILNEGSKSSPYMGLILSGKVDIIKTDTSGVKKNIAQLNKGKTFGEMSIIDGLISSAAVVTSNNVMLMVLNKEKFHQLIETSAKVGNKFLLMLLKLMSSKIRETSGKLVEYTGM